MRAKCSLRHAAELLSLSDVPVKRAAMVLARELNSPVTQAIKLWGDDEEPFMNLITARSVSAREWRRIMGRIIIKMNWLPTPTLCCQSPNHKMPIAVQISVAVVS